MGLMIEENLRQVRQNIANAALKSGRRPEDITLVCVTKEVTVDQVKKAIACGVDNIGENKLQDAIEKSLKLKDLNLKFHFIGHVQTNKVKKIVEIFDLVHSVDSFHIAEALSKEAAKINKIQDILIQVNTSGEQSKFGIGPHEATGLFRKLVSLNNIRALGLMTMAPLTTDQEIVRICFRKLKHVSEEVKDFLQFTTHNSQKAVLSMGMSGDYQAAIEEGATMVRIGSAIFR